MFHLEIKQDIYNVNVNVEQSMRLLHLLYGMENLLVVNLVQGEKKQ